METESAIRIFEKAYGWAKLAGGITTGILALLIAGGAYESFNLRRTVSDTLAAVSTAKSLAESQIHDTAAVTSSESMKSVEVIRAAAKSVDESSRQTQAAARSQGIAIKQQAAQVRLDFQSQATAVTKDVDLARKQIQAASLLQPQMLSLQEQLRAAQSQIQDQQHVLTSSEDFVKHIFASHKQVLFDSKTAAKTSFAVMDLGVTLNSQKLEAIYVLMPDAPLFNTLQIQFNQTNAAPQSFNALHNLVVLFINKAAQDELFGKVISVSYFPDPADKNLMHALTIVDGRVYADGEALPKLGQTDPDFKGSKWISAAEWANVTRK